MISGYIICTTGATNYEAMIISYGLRPISDDPCTTMTSQVYVV